MREVVVVVVFKFEVVASSWILTILFWSNIFYFNFWKQIEIVENEANTQEVCSAVSTSNSEFSIQSLLDCFEHVVSSVHSIASSLVKFIYIRLCV